MKEEFVFKKKYGQNFINNKRIIEDMVNSIDIENDNLVVEVGPGAGILTEELSGKFDQVLSYEIDTDLYERLLQKFENSNVDFIFDDFMKRNIVDDVKNYNKNNLYFVANLPYYITTPILQNLIDSKLAFKSIVIMIQKEVADRFCAKPGAKDYNSLTVYLNYFFEIKRICNVSRNNFYPVPNVDSSIIKLDRKENKIFIKNEDLFFKLVRDSFQFKRKTLRNNLKEYDMDIISKVLAKYDYDLSVRAEKLSFEIFADIANNL